MAENSMMINLSNPSNPRYIDRNQMFIALDVEINGTTMEFVARADDVEEHGRDLHERAVAGEFGDIRPYQKTESDKMSQAKSLMQTRIRDKLESYYPAMAAARLAFEAVERATTLEEVVRAFNEVEWP